MNEHDQSFDEDEEVRARIYPATPPEHAAPAPLPLTHFHSWHLPRKQWVRQHQWGASTSTLLDRLVGFDRPLRYLGLPGTELLDLDVLATICKDRRIQLRYLGFNSGVQTQVDRTTQRLAAAAIEELGVVADRSVLAEDDVCELESSKSVATARMKDFSSFDVVNLDFCGTFTGGSNNRWHTSLKAIVDHQLKGRRESWLLFLSSSTKPGAFHGEDTVQYGRLMAKNAARSPDFLAALNGLLPQPLSGSEDAGSSFDGATGSLLGKLVTIGLGKWLLSMFSPTHPWRVALKSIAYYRTGILKQGDVPADWEPDFVSVVFSIDPINVPTVDPTGLARTHAGSAPSWDSVEQLAGEQIAKKVGSAHDLDRLLQDQPEVASALAEVSAEMLGLRNYDTTRYRTWAAGVPLVP